MTWNDILRDRKRNHSVQKTELISEARKRLLKINQEDLDDLFRFRFSGKQRLWGIRQQQSFKLLWWDPDHEICPSAKR